MVAELVPVGLDPRDVERIQKKHLAFDRAMRQAENCLRDIARHIPDPYADILVERAVRLQQDTEALCAEMGAGGRPGQKPRAPLSKTKKLAADERLAYAQATEAARQPEGYLVCQRCGRSIPEGMEVRHHRRFRSRGRQDHDTQHRHCSRARVSCGAARNQGGGPVTRITWRLWRRIVAASAALSVAGTFYTAWLETQHPWSWVENATVTLLWATVGAGVATACCILLVFSARDS